MDFGTKHLRIASGFQGSAPDFAGLVVLLEGPPDIPFMLEGDGIVHRAIFLSPHDPNERLFKTSHLVQNVGLGVHEIAFPRHQLIGSRAAFQGAFKEVGGLFHGVATRQVVRVVVEDVSIFMGLNASLKRSF